MALIVRIKPLAERQIEAAALWWSKNRPAAPGAVRQDLQAALATLAEHPCIGTKVEGARDPGTRKLYLARPSEEASVTTSPLKGGCQCGSVRYRISGEPVMVALCHCSMCRRANAAPAVAWAMYCEAQVEFLGSEPAAYESSPGCRRGFCRACGTQISFTADYIPGLIDVTVGSLDDPNQVEPAFHYWESKRLSWLQLADELPRHAEFPPQPE